MFFVLGNNIIIIIIIIKSSFVVAVVPSPSCIEIFDAADLDFNYFANSILLSLVESKIVPHPPVIIRLLRLRVFTLHHALERIYFSLSLSDTAAAFLPMGMAAFTLQ